MLILKSILTIFVIVSAVFSAFMWIKSARAQVLADKTTGGYGCLMGGYIVVKGENNERIDFHKTFNMQSKWNSYAAYSAAFCAVMQALHFLLPA